MDASKFVTVELTLDCYRTLINLALELGGGMHASQMASLIFVNGLQTYAEKTQSPAGRLFILYQKVAEEKHSFRMLLSVARHLLSSPDDEKMEELVNLCDAMGVSTTDIIQQAQLDTTDRLSEISSRVTKTSLAEDFLLANMRPGIDYPAVILINRADAEGIKASHLKAARQRLQVSSIRGSDGFTWTLPAGIPVRMVENE